MAAFGDRCNEGAPAGAGPATHAAVVRRLIEAATTTTAPAEVFAEVAGRVVEEARGVRARDTRSHASPRTT